MKKKNRLPKSVSVTDDRTDKPKAAVKNNPKQPGDNTGKQPDRQPGNGSDNKPDDNLISGSGTEIPFGKKVRSVAVTDYEFDTDFTGDEPAPIKDGLDLFFDGQEKEKTEKKHDDWYETDSAFSVVEASQGKEVFKDLWVQRNDLLRQKISENEKHLLFIKKKIEGLKFAVKLNVTIFIICLLMVILMFLMRNVIIDIFRPIYIVFGLPLMGIAAFLSLFSAGRVVRLYRFHVKKDLGWTKPHPVEEHTLRYRRASRERNYKAEYEKVNWVLRQYDFERELMFVIKTHIDNGEIDDIEELKRQLHDVFIYEDVEPAMR